MPQHNIDDLQRDGLLLWVEAQLAHAQLEVGRPLQRHDGWEQHAGQAAADEPGSPVEPRVEANQVGRQGCEKEVGPGGRGDQEAEAEQHHHRHEDQVGRVRAH